MTPTTRQRRTPAERAQEAYDLSVRAVERLEAKLSEAQATVDELKPLVAEAMARRDYAALHPDLPKPAPKKAQAES